MRVADLVRLEADGALPEMFLFWGHRPPRGGGVAAKFGQHPALRDFLLGTGDRVLAEASPYDTVWGIGRSADEPEARHPARWRGLNLLGFALMDVRSSLR
jgi:ribA/ribD-fused uncharacterized protein